MIAPLRPNYLPKAYKKFRYIIIHDFSCQFANVPVAKIDNGKENTQKLTMYNWVFNSQYELPYHFVCEKIGDDYETFMARPFCYYCEYKDIPDQYLNSIHVAIAGDYNLIAPTQRAYQQMAYRSIASILRWYQMNINNVLMHYEISTDKECKCPGHFFKKSLLVSAMKQYSVMKK